MKRLPGIVACLLSATAINFSIPACQDSGGATTAGGAGGDATPPGGTTTSSGGAGGGTGASGGTTATSAVGGAGSGGAASATGGATAGSGGTTTGSGGARTGGTLGSGGARTGGTLGSGGTPRTGGSTSAGGTSATPSGGTGAGGTGGVTQAGGLTLYYVRHAEVIANVVDPSEITLENADTLTDLGIRQVEVLTTYLQDLGTPDAVLVSPHLRGQRTIGPYLAATGLSGEVWMELAEASDKKATGAPLPAEPKYIRFYKATLEIPSLTFRDPAKVEFWQNDTYEAGLLMVTTARDLLLERYSQSGKTLIVVGHAIAGQLLIGLLRGEDLLNGPVASGPSAVYILNTGIMKLTQDPSTGLFKLDGRNMNNPPTK